MDIVVWLRGLGLGRYEAAFRDNEIDETVLPNLTAEDLKDLGVSIVGHRRKLLDAIAALRTEAGAKAPQPDHDVHDGDPNSGLGAHHRPARSGCPGQPRYIAQKSEALQQLATVTLRRCTKRSRSEVRARVA